MVGKFWYAAAGADIDRRDDGNRIFDSNVASNATRLASCIKYLCSIIIWSYDQRKYSVRFFPRPRFPLQ